MLLQLPAAMTKKLIKKNDRIKYGKHKLNLQVQVGVEPADRVAQELVAGRRGDEVVELGVHRRELGGDLGAADRDAGVLRVRRGAGHGHRHDLTELLDDPGKPALTPSPYCCGAGHGEPPDR